MMMIGIMILNILWYWLLYWWKPVQPEMLVHKMGSQGDVGVLGPRWPNVSCRCHPHITEFRQKPDDIVKNRFGIGGHLLAVGARCFDVEGLVEEGQESVELRGVDEAEGEEVASNKLQQKPVELLLQLALGVNFGVLVHGLFHGHLTRDELGLLAELLRHVSFLGLLLPPHILPLIPMLPLQVWSERLGAASWKLILHLMSSRQTQFALGMQAIEAVVKILPNTRFCGSWLHLKKKNTSIVFKSNSNILTFRFAAMILLVWAIV